MAPGSSEREVLEPETEQQGARRAAKPRLFLPQQELRSNFPSGRSNQLHPSRRNTRTTAMIHDTVPAGLARKQESARQPGAGAVSGHLGPCFGSRVISLSSGLEPERPCTPECRVG